MTASRTNDHVGVRVRVDKTADTMDLQLDGGTTADELLRVVEQYIPQGARLGEALTITWLCGPDPAASPPQPSGGVEGMRPYFDHSTCDHEATPGARARCRQARRE
ncbi:hypothetical protein [Frankia casuarinae]|uniref:hypothetical protein n=1 Tax=Frankia casuarinae (strain DSM 45818 / CECT 9043 / HFP020203 / CcI3) TaxID=106370 RepID=UPI0010561B0A|nr:hypothetical protein [Frankia casuarinae]